MKEYLVLEQAVALIDGCPDPILLFDAADRIVALNPAARTLLASQALRLLTHRAGELPAGPLRDLVTGSDALTFRDDNQQTHHFAPIDLPLPSGAAAVRARLLRDISDRERLRTVLDAQALHDHTTGILNPRGLMVALEPQVSRSRRYNSPLALLMMDAYGERAEPAFLVQVSKVLRDELRWADIIGISDSHEFIIALPETRQTDALRLTEKLSARLSHEFEGKDSTWAAYGVVALQKTDDAATLLRRAHTALEQARSTRGGTAVAL